MPLSPLARRWAEATPNALAEARERLARAGQPVLDLITCSPTQTGLQFPQDKLIAIAERALREVESVHHYAPDSRGQRPAREAIAGHYARREVAIDADHITLSPGTSLSYLWALRLLLKAGEELLAPSPGYPLFDDIAALCGVRLRRYHLSQQATGWRPDLDEIAFQCTDRTRAIAVISPHNPTGTVWRREELAGLRDLCEERDLALIFDEVFSEHLAHPVTSLPRPEGFPLAIVLNGLSKMLSLPTWKIGWMAVTGDVSRCAPLCRSLEHMADTFLAVGELQQAMVPDLLRAGDSEVIAALAGEIGSRRTHAIQSLVPRPISPEGGVHLCCSLPDSIDDEEFALELLERHHVSVHPGHYYDLPHHFVMTCVATPEDLTRGAEAINRTLARRQTAAG